MARKRLRYSGFSFFARLFWAYENLESGKRISYPEMIRKADRHDFWVRSTSDMTKQWFKEKAHKYMTTTAFKEEKHRHELRQKGLNAYEEPAKWFSATVLKPSDWGIAISYFALYESVEALAKERCMEEEAKKKSKDEAIKKTSPEPNFYIGDNDSEDEEDLSSTDEDEYYFLK